MKYDEIIRETKKISIIDSQGHYDIDGVSFASEDGVIVAGEAPSEYPKIIFNQKSLEDKTLKQIESEADNNSIELKNQKSPSEDGIVDKTERLSSAQYSPTVNDYNEFEKAGG